MPANIEYVSAGTGEFDNLFGGKGIIVDPATGTSMLIEGDAGIGKTTLALQLATTAVRENNTSCLYYSFEQSAHEIKTLVDIHNWEVPTSIISWPDYHLPDIKSRFTIVDAHSVIGVEFGDSLDKIESHTKAIEDKGFPSPIVVLDSIGAVENLRKMERPLISRLISKMRQLDAVLILVREHHGEPAVSEYLTNVVIDLQKEYTLLVRHSLNDTGQFSLPSTTMMEIKKARNQNADRGPHRYEIRGSKDGAVGGIYVYPSLQAVAKATEISGLSSDLIDRHDRAPFGVPALDMALDDDVSGAASHPRHYSTADDRSRGMLRGQSLLVKGPPGSLKTELGIRFLLEGLRNSQVERALFVSCRLDRIALQDLQLYRDDDEKAEFMERLQFVDARHPYMAPEQTMSKIKEAVEGNFGANCQQQPIERAVIFGIGMLDTLPAFQRDSLPFLQVLIAYFRSRRISGVFIDWPRPDVDRSTQLLRPTELAGEFVAGAIDIREADKKLILTRKNHRFIDRELGYLRLEDGELIMDDEVSK